MFSKLLTPVLLSLIGLTVSVTQAQVDSNFHCYLLFGQSNMAGGGAGTPASFGGAGAGTLNAADCDTSPRVKVLAFCDCDPGSNTSCTPFAQKRLEDKWYTARPPLHICVEGVCPGDWFAKTMLDSIRDDIKIGLIPCALSAQALTVFAKGGSNFNISKGFHPTLGNNSPYAWMLAKCKLAQQTGVIKGILLHQGESGPGGETWKTLATQIFNDLKKDLNLPSTLPVVVGELREGSGMNQTIDQFATTYPNCGLASSKGVGNQPDDAWHFNPEGMREMGKRYAKAFLALASQQFVPRKGTVPVTRPPRAVSSAAVSSWKDGAKVFSLNGKVVSSVNSNGAINTLHGVRSGNVYLVARTSGTGVRLMVVP